MSSHRPESIDPSVRIMMHKDDATVAVDDEQPLLYIATCEALEFDPEVWNQERPSAYWMAYGRTPLPLPVGGKPEPEPEPEPRSSIDWDAVREWAKEYAGRPFDVSKLPRRTPGAQLGPMPDDFGTHEKAPSHGWGGGPVGFWKEKGYYEAPAYSHEGIREFFRGAGKVMLPDIERPEPTAIIPPIQPSADPPTQVMPVIPSLYELREYEPEETADIEPPDLASLVRHRPPIGGSST